MLHTKENRRAHISIRTLQITIITLLFIMMGRLFQLQIIEYETYGPLSLANSIRQEAVNPARGLIFDRSGRMLVDNQPIYTLTITPASFDTDNIPLLAGYLGICKDKLAQRIQDARQYSWHRPSRLITDIDFHAFSKVQENLWQLPGIGHHVESKRAYPTDIRASHIFGYLSEVTRDEYTRSRRYHLGDKTGRSGLEQIYEKELRGDLGTQYLRINALGQALGPYEGKKMGKSPIKGADIYTHIDSDLQLLGETLMKNKTGGLVAMDPNTGAILALVSSPDYDIKRLSGRIETQYWVSLQADTTNPLFNRAISAMQPPGSTIKPIMGLIGLELGVITPNTTINCRGRFTLGRDYRCLKVHGQQNLEQAIKNSCNTYFFSLMNQLMEKEGLNRWHQYAGTFGFGQLSHIDLPHERRGILPDSAYYERIFGGPLNWGIGDLISVGVGQGTFSVSPLQMALATSQIANGGYRVKPHVVDRVSYPDGTTRIIAPEKEKAEWIKQENLEHIQKGMRLAVTKGSGRFYANIPGVAVAGKTGTSQNPHGNNHGWFISYAPYDEPEIAIAVLMENAGFGSVSAAPVAGLLMEKYFHGQIRRQWVYDYVMTFKPKDKEEREVL